jgi:hypothetical protein
MMMLRRRMAGVGVKQRKTFQRHVLLFCAFVQCLMYLKKNGEHVRGIDLLFLNKKEEEKDEKQKKEEMRFQSYKIT